MNATSEDPVHLAWTVNQIKRQSYETIIKIFDAVFRSCQVNWQGAGRANSLPGWPSILRSCQMNWQGAGNLGPRPPRVDGEPDWRVVLNATSEDPVHLAWTVNQIKRQSYETIIKIFDAVFRSCRMNRRGGVLSLDFPQIIGFSMLNAHFFGNMIYPITK